MEQVTAPIVLPYLRLHTRHVPDIQQFRNVTHLNLAHNKLSTIAELHLPSLLSLELLDLHDNALAYVATSFGAAPHTAALGSDCITPVSCH